MQYKVKIEFIASYIQGRFSEAAKSDLAIKSGKKAKSQENNDEWKQYAYQDEKGFYIPALQIKYNLINGGKEIKRKATSNFKNIVKALFNIIPEKIYLNKTDPDFISTSYPQRKDGLRVKLQKPAFNTGTQVEFTIEVLEDLDDKTVEYIVEKAGQLYGLGSWRPINGRYKIIKFEKI